MKKDNKELTVNDFVEVKDIKNGFLYRKDGYILKFLRIFPFNINLKSNDELAKITNILASGFRGSKREFTFMSYSREVDLDSYKMFVAGKLSEEISDPLRKMTLQEMNLEANVLGSNGENYEHQFYFKIWEKQKKENYFVEVELNERMNEYSMVFQNAGMTTKILTDIEIIKLCNLFNNSTQAPYEVTMEAVLFQPHMQILE